MKRFQKKLFLAVALLAGVLCGGPGHLAAQHAGDLVIASTASGGGNLAVDFDFSQKVQTSYFATVGSVAVYTSTEPGFDALDQDEPPEFYVLTNGTRVAIEVVHVDPPGGAKIVFPNGNAFRAPNATLANPGDSVTIGEQGAPDPDGLHHHAQMQLILALPAGTFGEARIAFKLTTTNPAYSASDIYTLTLTNGHLAPVQFGGPPTTDQASVLCQKTVGKEARKFLNKKLVFLSQCLDAITLYNARNAAGSNPAPALQAAKKKCGDASITSGPDAKTMLGKIEAAQSQAVAAIKAKCGSAGSGDFTQDEDIAAHIGMVRCRAEELLSASYNTAKHDLEQFSARSSQGGQPLDTYFPCLVPSPE